MVQASKALPADYERRGTLDLAKNRLLAIGLTIAAGALLLPVGWLVLQFIRWARPEAGSFDLRAGLSGTFLVLAALLALTILMMVAHEALHGLCFWGITRERPRFGFRGLYAFAAAPAWYLPRGQYAVVGLAPLVVITVAGLALLTVVPGPAIPALLLFVVFNAAGSAGDLITVGWLLIGPRESLVRDSGDAITLYGPAHVAAGVDAGVSAASTRRPVTPDTPQVPATGSAAPSPGTSAPRGPRR